MRIEEQNEFELRFKRLMDHLDALTDAENARIAERRARSGTGHKKKRAK